jgi:hypothetical protein
VQVFSPPNLAGYRLQFWRKSANIGVRFWTLSLRVPIWHRREGS